MGWTSYYARYFRNGKINRKAECDHYFDGCTNYKVVKSTMVGTTYYAAIDNGENVFAVVFLTKIEERGTCFAYKDMDETMGPYYYDCPTSILDLLSPTDNKSALEWRKTCRKYNAESTLARKRAKALKQARRISITFEHDWNFHNAGETITLTRTPYIGRDVWVIDGDSHYIRQSDIAKLGYKILEEAA